MKSTSLHYVITFILLFKIIHNKEKYITSNCEIRVFLVLQLDMFVYLHDKPCKIQKRVQE